MKRTWLQRNTIDEQRKLNTDGPTRYSSGIGEFHPAGIFLKDQRFDLKGKQRINHFVRMKRTCRRFIIFKDMAQKRIKLKFKVETSWHESSMRTLNYSIM